MKRWLLYGIFLVIGGVSSALALTENFTMDATLVAPIAINEIQAMNFGSVTIPSSGSHAYTITSAGGASASAGGEFAGTQAEANFTITGSSSITVDLGVAFTASSCGAGNGSLTAFTTDWNSGTIGGANQTGLTITAGSIPLTVGSTLTVNNTASPGACNQTYDVTVTYN